MPAILYNDIFDDNEDAQKFLDVCLCFNVLLSDSVRVNESIDDESVIESLKMVSGLVSFNKEERDGNLGLFFEKVEQDNLLSYINPQTVLEKAGRLYKSSYFTFLEKSWNEDFYSDHLNSLINFPFKNDLQKTFISTLIDRLFKGHAFNLDGLKSFREVSLLNFDYDEAPQMRMDLFVKNNANQVIIIENKTKTLEHSSQTIHYYDALLNKHEESEIFAIMLSPSGIKAECEKFKILTYQDLFFIFSHCIEVSPPEKEELELIIDFYQELKEQFYDPYDRSIKRAQEFRRKHG